MKNNVYLRCVYKKNLGDDLIIKVLCDRYPHTIFHVIDYRGKGEYLKLDNLKVHKFNNLLYRIDRKIMTKINRISLHDWVILKRCNIVVSAAGSIFMEPTNQYDYIWYEHCNRPYYIIGSNIGPVRTEAFKNNIINKTIRNAKDVCLRDKRSYELCKELDNVRMAPDIVFGYNLSKIRKRKEKSISVSIINCLLKSKQTRGDFSEKYEKSILDICNFYYKKGYKIKLFSFCKDEGDDKTALEIKDKLKLMGINSDIYLYDGDIDGYVSDFISSKLIVGSRFHANILGAIASTPVFPISYNDKTRAMLEDINFQGPYIDLESEEEIIIANLLDMQELRALNIDQERTESAKQFMVLDKILK